MPKANAAPSLSRDFIARVLDNMARLDAAISGKGGTKVRFGLPAGNPSPNYQIETSDGIHAMRGTDHQPDPSAIGARYWESDLSAEEHTLAQVHARLRACK